MTSLRAVPREVLGLDWHMGWRESDSPRPTPSRLIIILPSTQRFFIEQLLCPNRTHPVSALREPRRVERRKNQHVNYYKPWEIVDKELACPGDRNKKCSLVSQRRNSHRKIISCQDVSLPPIGSLGSHHLVPPSYSHFSTLASSSLPLSLWLNSGHPQVVASALYQHDSHNSFTLLRGQDSQERG